MVAEINQYTTFISEWGDGGGDQESDFIHHAEDISNVGTLSNDGNTRNPMLLLVR
jgi:hypothetical protein